MGKIELYKNILDSLKSETKREYCRSCFGKGYNRISKSETVQCSKCGGKGYQEYNECKNPFLEE